MVCLNGEILKPLETMILKNFVVQAELVNLKWSIMFYPDGFLSKTVQSLNRSFSLKIHAGYQITFQVQIYLFVWLFVRLF